MNSDILSSIGFSPTASTMRRESNSKLPFGGGSRGGGKKDIIPKGYRGGVLEQFTPEQLEMFQNLFSQLSPDSDIFKMASGDQSFFDEMERPALRDFGGIQGNIAGRFSQGGGGQGAMSSRRSSGFQNTMNQAGSDFAQRLASNRQNLSRQALKDLMEMSHMLMGERPSERILAPKEQKEPGFWKTLGSSFAQSAGKAAGEKIFSGFGGGGGIQSGGLSSGGSMY